MEGVTFIPPHLAEKVATVSEETQLHDQWGHLMLREGKYTPGQIDSRWTDQIRECGDRLRFFPFSKSGKA